MVTPEEVELVQSSWAKVEPIADTAADLFYGRLFEIAPETKTLFPAEMVEQKKKLMQTLAVCVNGLNNLGEIVPAVLALGRRHVDYKVSDEHYDSVGAALLWTLEQGLGEDFTPETSSAWTTVYGILATTMKDAAAQAA
ncbi:MAG TPA: hemin receptor [Planctomycetaceae bacterium]|nr:hemin receptor [Planctomycetaceae bacterium]